MNIKPMLVRLQSAIGRNDLVEEMVLLPEPSKSAAEGEKSSNSVNLIVGYNSSPGSQTALDLTLWIAHQTRLVTKAQVTVQVVYVVDENQTRKCSNTFNSAEGKKLSIPQLPLEFPTSSAYKSGTPVLSHARQEALATHPQITSVDSSYFSTQLRQPHSFEQADQILWKARCLADEWRGSFKAHLRFGCIATELRKVVESESAALLFLGCNSAEHSIVQKLGANFPCPVLGIPTTLSLHEEVYLEK